MSTLANSQSAIRLHRAHAARALLQLHKADQLDNPEMWSWDVLDALPQWCLLDTSPRMQLQLCCGALSHASELRLWIDRELIITAHSIISESLFNAIVDHTFSSSFSSTSALRQSSSNASVDATTVGTMQLIFKQAGAAVLAGTLPKQLPSSLLSDSLGDASSIVEPAQANDLLRLATELMNEVAVQQAMNTAEEVVA